MNRHITTLTYLACVLTLTTSAALAHGDGQAHNRQQLNDRHQDHEPPDEQYSVPASQREKDRKQAAERASAPREEAHPKNDAEDDEEQQDSNPENRRIYGQELMTAEERKQYREKLSGLESGDARREFVAEHREAMRRRAKQQVREADYREGSR